MWILVYTLLPYDTELCLIFCLEHNVYMGILFKYIVKEYILTLCKNKYFGLVSFIDIFFAVFIIFF